MQPRIICKEHLENPSAIEQQLLSLCYINATIRIIRIIQFDIAKDLAFQLKLPLTLL